MAFDGGCQVLRHVLGLLDLPLRLRLQRQDQVVEEEHRCLQYSQVNRMQALGVDGSQCMWCEYNKCFIVIGDPGRLF